MPQSRSRSTVEQELVVQEVRGLLPCWLRAPRALPGELVVQEVRPLGQECLRSLLTHFGPTPCLSPRASAELEPVVLKVLAVTLVVPEVHLVPEACLEPVVLKVPVVTLVVPDVLVPPGCPRFWPVDLVIGSSAAVLAFSVPRRLLEFVVPNWLGELLGQDHQDEPYC